MIRPDMAVRSTRLETSTRRYQTALACRGGDCREASGSARSRGRMNRDAVEPSTWLPEPRREAGRGGCLPSLTTARSQARRDVGGLRWSDPGAKTPSSSPPAFCQREWHVQRKLPVPPVVPSCSKKVPSLVPSYSPLSVNFCTDLHSAGRKTQDSGPRKLAGITGKARRNGLFPAGKQAVLIQ